MPADVIVSPSLSLRSFLLSLRAEGVATSVGYQIAALVPSVSEESHFEIASSSLTSFGIPRNDRRGSL